MANTVWKYQLTKEDQVISLPVGAVVLSVAVQNGTTCMWVKLDPEEPKVSRRFVELGTGGVFPEDIIPNSEYFIGTCHHHHGQIVTHVFEVYDKVK